jgi:hypothetical protein
LSLEPWAKPAPQRCWGHADWRATKWEQLGDLAVSTVWVNVFYMFCINSFSVNSLEKVIYWWRHFEQMSELLALHSPGCRILHERVSFKTYLSTLSTQWTITTTGHFCQFVFAFFFFCDTYLSIFYGAFVAPTTTGG